MQANYRNTSEKKQHNLIIRKEKKMLIYVWQIIS